MGNYDGTTTCDIEVIPEFNVLVGVPVTKTLTNVHVTMEVQVAPLVVGQNGTLDTNIFCTSG
jgi:hypothetical protein